MENTETCEREICRKTLNPILFIILICIAFYSGFMLHYSIGIKKSEYDALQKETVQTEEEVTVLKNEFDTYMEKMMPYEEVYILEQTNIADRKKLTEEKQKKEDEEADAIEYMENKLASQVMELWIDNYIMYFN